MPAKLAFPYEVVGVTRVNFHVKNVAGVISDKIAEFIFEQNVGCFNQCCAFRVFFFSSAKLVPPSPGFDSVSDEATTRKIILL